MDEPIDSKDMKAEVDMGAEAGIELSAAPPRPVRVSTSRVVLVAGTFIAVVIAATVLPFVSRIPMPPWVTPLDQIVRLLGSLLWLLALLVSLIRFPDNPIWKLILAFNVVAQISRVYALGDSLVYSLVLLLGNLGLAVYIHLVLAFPTGHLTSRFDRRLVAFTYAWILTFGILGTLMGGDWAAVRPYIQNVLALGLNVDALEIGARLQALIGVVICAIVPFALWRHWRDASPVGRRPLVPVLLSAPLMFGGIAIANVEAAFHVAIPPLLPEPWWILAIPVQFIIPGGLLLGVLRLRLSRGRIADVVVELGRGVPVGRLRDILARALGDPTLQLAFAASAGDGFVDTDGRPVEVPPAGASRAVTRLQHGGELVGLLVHDPALDDEDPGLVEAVGAAARLAIENERLAAQVRAQLDEVRESRTRIIEAADAERRRVERDLHDGAQQRLVALAMRLELARESTPGASSLLDEATAELRTAIGEVRDLARGLHPTILTEAGLLAAVEALAERTPVPVNVDVPAGRYPGPIEATAYFVVAEALTNVARHAKASEAHVLVAVEADRLVVTVRDDGHGGADPTKGSGLRGLSDRIAAASGSLILTSSPGAGTTVRAELPLG